MLLLFTLLPAFASVATAVMGRRDSSPPAGSITVCPSGCNFKTIQSAVSSISPSSTSAHTIYIYKGTYTEQVTIPKLSGAIKMYGETSDPSSYVKNTVNLEWKSSKASGAASDQATSALINLSSNTAIYNINVRNTYGQGSQAVALSAANSRQGYYGMALYGYQDTLYAEQGTQVYGQCYLQGATDFVFGRARMWMTKTTLAVSGAGFITASGRASDSDDGYYVIDRATVSTASGASVAPGSVYLGRPWAEYARVCVQDTTLPSIINDAGWTQWTSSQPNTAHAVFQEYNNAGPGSTGKRAPFATKLTQPVSIDTILGSDYASWVDKAYI